MRRAVRDRLRHQQLQPRRTWPAPPEVAAIFDPVRRGAGVEDARGAQARARASTELACEAVGVRARRGGLPRRPRHQPEAGPGHGHAHHQGDRSRRGAGRAVDVDRLGSRRPGWWQGVAKVDRGNRVDRGSPTCRPRPRPGLGLRLHHGLRPSAGAGGRGQGGRGSLPVGEQSRSGIDGRGGALGGGSPRALLLGLLRGVGGQELPVPGSSDQPEALMGLEPVMVLA